MSVARQPARIGVFVGCFASQPLVFAHLMDEAPELSMERIEVCQGTGLRARLGGYFDAATVTEVLVALEGDDSCVLLLPGAGAFSGSPRLRPLGAFDGHLTRALP